MNHKLESVQYTKKSKVESENLIEYLPIDLQHLCFDYLNENDILSHLYASRKMAVIDHSLLLYYCRNHKSTDFSDWFLDIVCFLPGAENIIRILCLRGVLTEEFFNRKEVGPNLIRWWKNNRLIFFLDIFPPQPKEVIKSVSYAAREGNLEIIKFMVNKYNVTANDLRNDRNNSALRNAAEFGFVDILRYLKYTIGLTVEDARSADNQAFCTAASNGNVAVLKCLRYDYGLNSTDARADCNRALIRAARQEDVETVRCLKEDYELDFFDARSISYHFDAHNIRVLTQIFRS